MPAGAAGKVIALENGDMVPWMRYGAWLLTCPTLLTLLANVSGDGSFAPRKLLLLLKVDQGMLVCGTFGPYCALAAPHAPPGISAAIMTGSWKWIVWSIGAILGCIMFLMLWFIWQYAVLTLPKRAKVRSSVQRNTNHRIVVLQQASLMNTFGLTFISVLDATILLFELQPYVNTMFQVTFATWPGYPLLFLLGEVLALHVAGLAMLSVVCIRICRADGSKCDHR